MSGSPGWFRPSPLDLLDLPVQDPPGRSKMDEYEWMRLTALKTSPNHHVGPFLAPFPNSKNCSARLEADAHPVVRQAECCGLNR